MEKYRYGGHTVTRLTVHLVWVTKYRYHVLTGDIQKRCREILIQICDTEDVRIFNGVVSKDHVPMFFQPFLELLENSMIEQRHRLS